jgi:hypothetical protein
VLKDENAYENEVYNTIEDENAYENEVYNTIEDENAYAYINTTCSVYMYYLHDHK